MTLMLMELLRKDSREDEITLSTTEIRTGDLNRSRSAFGIISIEV